MTLSAISYIYYAWIGKTEPVIATWLMLFVMLSLSFWMYWTSPNKSWSGNLAVTIGVLNILTILLGVIAVHIRNRTLGVAFDATQKKCLIAGACIVGFWFITDQILLSYCLIQAIALIGFFATMKKLWRATNNTEPLFFWIILLIINILAVYPAIVKNDIYGWIHLGRAIPSISIVIFLIRRAKQKSRRLNPR